MIEATLGRLAAGENLSLEEMQATLQLVMQGKCTPGEIGLLLTGLRLKGETPDELAGAALAMREFMTPIPSTHEVFIDTCGTGGGGKGTFNISTAAAIVTAAAGLPVAKHGNRKITSKTGSADALEALGVNVEAGMETVAGCLNELGICFCYAPLHHQSMRHVAEVRRKLGVPTIFNMLGPLANPAGAPFQVLGVPRPETADLIANALTRLNVRKAVVVTGSDGLGEVTLAGPTQVILIAGTSRSELTWEPADFGLAAQSLDELAAEDPQESAACIRQVLAGEPGPARDIVVLNAAAALWTAGSDAARPLSEYAQQAAAAIDSGQANDLLQRLAARTHAA